jgi:membrane protease YdiL (CAAX protease family)
MLIGVPLLLLQVTSEELVFRGYLQQQLAARFDSRWIWYVLPSVLFGFLHYDTEIMGSNAWIVVAHTTIFGMIAADVTARTGNLGAAIGLHFANNLFALTIISLDGSLSGLGLYKTAFHVSDEVAIRSVLIPDIFFLILLYGLFLYWCRNKPQL